MRQLTAIVGFAALCLGLNALAADNTVDFSGKWILSNEKSDPTPRKTIIGRAVDDGRGGTRIDGSIGGIGGGAGGSRVGAGKEGPRLGSGRVEPGSGMEGGRVGAGKVSPGMGSGRVGPSIGIDGGTFDSESRIAREVPLIVAQTETEVRIVNTFKINGANVPTAESYTLDGEKHEEVVAFVSGTEGKRITKAKLSKNKITIEITTYNSQGAKFLMNKEYSLSKDGRTLTLKVTMQSPIWLSSEQRVYDKQ